jgi:hypothetical protein
MTEKEATCMRIQETDRILKDARVSRHAAGHENESQGNVVSRVWRSISSLPGKLFHHK